MPDRFERLLGSDLRGKSARTALHLRGFVANSVACPGENLLLVTVLSVIVVNVLSDMLYGFIDPRIRYG